MPKDIVIDELHITVFVARRLPSIETVAIRRSLRSASFRARLGGPSRRCSTDISLSTKRRWKCRIEGK